MPNAENGVACRDCGVGDRVCIEYNESGRGIKCCPDCDHRPSAEKDVPTLCIRCHGDLGWYGLHGAWEPCPDCDPCPIPPGQGEEG